MIKHPWLDKIYRLLPKKTPEFVVREATGIHSQDLIREKYALMCLSIQKPKTVEMLSGVFTSHEMCRQFILDIAMTRDLAELMVDYGMVYNDELTVDDNFTTLITLFLDGKVKKV
jgi:hypothetical protein